MTLLELIVAMVIISLIATMGLVAYNGQADDKALRTAASKIEALASKGHTQAYLRQTPHRLALLDDRTLVLESAMNQQSSTPGESHDQRYREVDRFQADVTVSLRRWGAKEDTWLNPIITKESSRPHYWQFTPAGLCEPLSIRLVDGQNWIILDMNPLTARVKDQQSYIAK